MRTVLLLLLIAASLPSVSRGQLVPQPREYAENGRIPLRAGVSIETPADEDDRFAARDLADELRERGIRVVTAGGASAVRVAFLREGSAGARRLLERKSLRFDAAMRAEGYVLVSEGGRVSIVAASDAGAFYGAQTVKQLVDGAGDGATLRAATIRDWPAMRYRGFHDDLSRGPLPTLEFQKKQIRTFAAYKLNVYSPYFEHTLTYRSLPLIAPPGGAMSHDQVRELIAYAKRYHIDVIPEQEAFGHLHHVLKYELYDSLAETPHGHVLAPDKPGSIALIKQMFAEIDSLFPSRFVHLGADETFELGRGQTSERVRRDGLGKVYVDFLKAIVDTLRAARRASSAGGAGADKRYLFWGDVAMSSPDLVKTLPKDMIAVGWWYNPVPAGFDKYLKPFVDAGMETWVAPGVNNWNRVYPNNALTLPNIQGFIRDGQRLGSTGALTTNWDDDGEGLFNQAWYGVLFGAAASWQKGESDTTAFQRAFGRVFHGDTTGRLNDAQRKLAAAHVLLQKAGAGDGSDFLFWIDPWSAEGQSLGDRVRPVARDVRLLAESALVLIDKARQTQRLRETDAVEATELGARRIDWLAAKFQFTDEIAQIWQRAGDSTNRAPVYDLSDVSGINGRTQDLRDGYMLLRDLYERAWLKENRPYWLGNVLIRYDKATQLWIDRMDRVNVARREWQRTRKVPSAESIGLPVRKP